MKNGASKRVLAGDDSVAQIDLSGISEDRGTTPLGKGVTADDEEDLKDKAQSMEPMSRDPRSPMDP